MAEGSRVAPFALTVGAIVLAVVAGAVAWFTFPAPDANHRFTSPSGRNTIALNEQCTEAGCSRTAVLEESGSRQGCLFELAEPRPMLLNAHPLWASDENSVDIVYADAEGVGGKIAIDLDRDCTDPL